jgi:hypothetical protein
LAFSVWVAFSVWAPASAGSAISEAAATAARHATYFLIEKSPFWLVGLGIGCVYVLTHPYMTGAVAVV